MANEMPSGKSLDSDFMFTKLVVNDLDKAAAFYTSVFGLIEMHRLDAKITGRAVSEIVYMSTYPGGPMFILAKFHDVQKPASDESILGFSTKDMDALVQRVEAAGGRLVEVIPESAQMPFRTAFIEDAEGHLVQVSQVVG
jgi:predicted enzyme related to lactoylglutathione lyase